MHTGTQALAEQLELSPDARDLPAGTHGLNSTRTLVLAFAGPNVDQNAPVFERLAGAFPDSVIVGCSTSGNIHRSQIGDGTVSVAVRKYLHTDLCTASAPVSAEAGSCAAGEVLGIQLRRPNLSGVFVLSDGLHVNGSELIRGMVSVLGDVPITGGLAGDGDRFQKTWVIRAGKPESGCVVGVGFCGTRIRFGHGTCAGWDSFGIERRITKSEKNVLFELDGQPALDVYKKYLGERAAELPASALLFPLSIRMPGGSEDGLVRTILAIDEGTRSMTFAGDVPEGAIGRFMKANPERLIGAAMEAGTGALDGAGAGADLMIAVSCVGRRLVLGPRAVEEPEALWECARGGLLTGFYSYGEIGPSAHGPCALHNQTMTVTTIREM